MKPELSDKIKEEVMKLLKVGFIETIPYADWIANIVPVIKKDGKIRVCVDYRDLNKASPKDDFPLPHIDVTVDSTAGFELFSFMDGFSGYNQIPMKEEDKDKTSFTTPWGNFCYKVMPFGLRNAGAMYQKAMALEKIKQYLISPPVLVPPIPEYPPTLYLTIHQESLGALLAQTNPKDGKERAIYYPSKKFTTSEMNYSPIERTRVAIVWVLRRLRQYTLHYHIQLVTENDPIKYLLEKPTLVGKLAKWQVMLSEFDIRSSPQKSVKGRAIADLLA
ncbi:uncharacterized protein LOC125313654 [Rhodamnia argentea]|uniref:Uncharacterized protein LOC125313654 n=1 Tax=Rhodamnia argentea TaxID=178133 RepID=A0ABM3GYI2_9MYRT|nr:uncharacterized protein LOC125313654 [Rhodamnia argentea]